MPLLAGLGNPGPKYDSTRHNVGFALADAAARALGADAWREKGKALVCRATLGNETLWIAKPQTYMNLSGEAVQALMTFHKIPPSEVAVVTDDVTLPLGSVRIRPSGGHGGHNGLRDIIARIGEGFPRIRVGVGLCPPGRDLSGFVLSRLNGDEQAALAPLLSDFPDLLRTGFRQGWDLAATRYNRRADSPAR